MHQMTGLRALCAGVLAATMLALSACGGGGGGGGGGAVIIPPGTPVTPVGPATPAPSAARIENVSIASAFNNTSYPVEVYLPAGYDSPSASYPVVYVLDGDSQLNLNETRFANFRRVLETRQKKAILVGVGNTRNRNIDYTLPGGLNYHNFLVKELVPLVEKRYRTDPSRRMLSGHSLSGSYVVAALFIEARSPTSLVFTHFLSSDGAFHGEYLNQIDALEREVFTTIGATALPVDLLMARGATANSNDRAVKEFYNRLFARQYKGLRLVETQFSQSHGPMDIPAFEDAVDRYID